MGKQSPKLSSAKQASKSKPPPTPPSSTPVLWLWMALLAAVLAVLVALVVASGAVPLFSRPTTVSGNERRAIVTPSYVLRVLKDAEQHEWPLGVPAPHSFNDRTAVLSRARAHMKAGELRQAATAYRELMTHDPWDKQVLRELYHVYKLLYGRDVCFNTKLNFTRTFLRPMEAHAAAGEFALEDGRRVTVQRLSTRLPVFQVDGLLSDAECDGIRDLHESLIGNLSMPPLVCFKNDAFIHNAELQRHFLKPDPREDAQSAKTTRFCLNQRASRAFGAAAAWSYSTFVYNGEHVVTDVLSQRLEHYFGLVQTHALSWQLLSYPQHVAYDDHTDCTAGDTIEQQCKARFSDRVATVLAYLTRGVQGGHTEFPELGIKVEPKLGRVLLFGGFGGNQKCDLASTHRSNAVTGDKTKVVAQRWYTYCQDRFTGEERPVDPPRGLPGQGRQPYQPMVSCDYTIGSESFQTPDGIPDWPSTCRWYDHDPL